MGRWLFARFFPAPNERTVQIIFHRILLLAVVSSSCSNLAYATTPPAVDFRDRFEGVAIYPYWRLRTENGSIAISKDVAYSGSHALKFSSSSGGNREISLIHSFRLLTKGTVSIAFYDAAAGEETLYEQLAVFDLAA